MAHAKLSALTMALLLAAGSSWAAEESEEPVKEPPKDAKKLGSDESACHTHARAGYPLCISSHAIPTDSCGYCGYYVGGGSLRFGGSVSPSCRELGTWGRDWCGCYFLHPKIMLGWAGRYQGGTGSYRTGSRDIPDVVAAGVALPETLHQKRKDKYCPPEEGH